VRQGDPLAPALFACNNFSCVLSLRVEEA